MYKIIFKLVKADHSTAILEDFFDYDEIEQTNFLLYAESNALII